MLKITVPATESYDEETNSFINSKEQTIQLEHSLISISRWESKWKKPFLAKQTKTIAETVDYIKCMTITQNISDYTYKLLTNENIKEIQEYIEDAMTATSLCNNGQPNREVITSELIYYWMISMNIPFECEKWHLNRLLTLINICNLKNTPPKKMSNKEILSRNASINAARRKELNSQG